MLAFLGAKMYRKDSEVTKTKTPKKSCDLSLYDISTTTYLAISLSFERDIFFAASLLSLPYYAILQT